MIAENLAVQDDPRAEHRFVDLEQRHRRRWLIESESAPIPERVALRVLLRDLAAGRDLRPRRIDESGVASDTRPGTGTVRSKAVGA